MKHLKPLVLNEKSLSVHEDYYGYYSLCNMCAEVSELATELKRRGVNCTFDAYSNFIDIVAQDDAEAMMVANLIVSDRFEGDKSDEVETDDAGIIRQGML